MFEDVVNEPIDKPFTDAEKIVLGWIGSKLNFSGFSRPGSFHCALLEAISHADRGNRAKLHIAFPEIVDAMNSWSYGNLADRLEYCEVEDTL